MMATVAAATRNPTMALIGQGGRIEQTTGAFWASCADAEELCRGSPEIDGVLNGWAAEATLSFGELTATVEAAIGADGERRALLTIPPATEVPPAGPDNALLAELLDDSPAIVWLKGLDGRYLQVNERFTSLLDTSAKRVCGSTDAELEPQETVDGPRLLDRDESLPEPLQLEYTVPAFKGRPALAVLRFPVRERDGRPVAICGVAAHFAGAEVARAEAFRLIQIERWSWADPETIRAELLADWEVTVGPGEDAGDLGPAPGSREPAGAEHGEALGAAITERDAALATNDWLQRQLDEERTQAAARGEASATSSTQMQELTSALEAAVARHQELEDDLAQAAQRAELAGVGLDEQLEQQQRHAQEAQAASEAALSGIQRLEEELELGRRRAADLEDEVRNAHLHADGLTGTLEAERALREDLEGVLAEEQRRAAALDGSRGEELGEQKQRAEQARAAAEVVSAELAEQRQRIEYASAEAEAVSADRDTALATIESLEGELVEARSRAAELSEAVLAADRRADELTGTLENERDGRVELKLAIAQAQERLEATDLARSAELAEQQQRLEQVRAEGAAMSAELAEQRQQAEQARAQAEALSTERDTALSTIEDLGRKLEEATRAAADLDEAVRGAHEHANGLTATLEAERLQREELESALTQEQRRATDLDGARGEELAEQRQRTEEARVLAEAMSAERDAAQVRAEAISAERDAALATIAGLGRELEEATREAVELGDAVRAADRHARELTGTVESERDGREELELAIAQAQKRLEATDHKREVELVVQRQRVEQARAEADAVTAERDEQRQRAEQARAEATATSAERDAALATIENLGRDLEEAAGRAAELGDAVLAADRRTDELTGTLETERDRREALERAIAQAEQRLEAAGQAREAELVEQRLQAEQARIQAEAVSAERDSALLAIEDLGRELKEAVGRAAELGDAARVADERTDELTGTLETARDARDQLERAIAQGEERVAQAEERVAQAQRDHEAELVEHRRQAEQAQADTEIAAAAHDSALMAVQGLKAELDEERGQRSALSETSARRVDELSQALADEQARVLNLERGLAEATSHLAELDARPSNEELAVERRRTQEATAEAERSRASADSAAAELAAALSARVALEREVEQKRVRDLAATDETSATSSSHAQELLELVESERVRVVDLEAALAQAHDKITRLADRPALEELEAQRNRAERAEAEMLGVRTQAERARRDAQVADARAEAARADALAVKADARGGGGRADALAVKAEAEALRKALVEPLEEHSDAGWTPGEPSAPPEAPAVEEPPSTRRPTWSTGSDLVISESLASATDWRTGMKAAVKTIGLEGEWDAVTVWLSEGQDVLTSAAMWTVDAKLAVFETLTWQTRPSVSGSRLGQALLAARPTWVTDIDQEQDNRLSRAAGNGMRSALLVPMRDGSSDLGVLELLTRARIEPDAEIALALEEASHQLALLASATTTGWKPWRL